MIWASTKHNNWMIVFACIRYSFGCGIDAITSDEVRDILKDGNKFYTQIKIDEIDNLGAAKIRLRSLKEAIAQKKGV